ncbi:MAG: hypothetical protein ABI811_16165 [Acidobacteriota bacterium]
MPMIDKNSKAGSFLSHFVPVLRPMRVLWNEVIGFVFCVFGVILAGQAIRGFRMLEAGEASPGRLFLLFVLPVIMLYFGITSFLRARRIHRS